MNILFIHSNFPAQFRHMATHFGANPQHRVVFATMNERPEWNIKGVAKAVFALKKNTASQVFHLAKQFDEATRKGEGLYHVAKALKEKGFVPDVVVGHSGWGNTMFVKDVFPKARFLCYFEWFYNAHGADADFDPDDKLSERGAIAIRTKNAPILIDLYSCNFGYCPTHWQHSQFPPLFRPKITVRHDGVDTNYFQPNPGARLVLPDLDLSLHEEIVTYATRGMEPYRGFPQFLEAAAIIQQRRPKAQIVIAGDDRVCYGKKPPKGQGDSWKELMLKKLDKELDHSRLHFTGSLPYGQYKALLQASAAHVYLTRPFVLSWSMIESMACGCLVCASNTPPVREVIQHEKNGLLFDFFNPAELADRVDTALDHKQEMAAIRNAARRTAEERYSLQKLLPGHIRIVENLGAMKHPLEGLTQPKELGQRTMSPPRLFG